MDSCLELVIEVLTFFSEFYTTDWELQKDKKKISEMEKNEEDYYTAYGTAQEYLNLRKDDSSRITSDVLSIDMLQRMNRDIKEGLHDTVTTKGIPRGTNSRQNEVFDRSPMPTTTTQGTSFPYQVTNQTKSSSNVLIHRLSEHRDTTNTEPYMQDENRYRLAGHGTIRYPVEEETRVVNSHAISTGLMEKSVGPSIGQDLWRQLKRVQIPVFAGNKRA